MGCRESDTMFPRECEWSRFVELGGSKGSTRNGQVAWVRAVEEVDLCSAPTLATIGWSVYDSEPSMWKVKDEKICYGDAPPHVLASALFTSSIETLILDM